MSVHFSELCIDCADPRQLAGFWSKVLGWRIEMDTPDDDEVAVVDPEGKAPLLLFAPVPEKKTVKNRLHIDVSPEPGQEDQEVERIIGLGATHADVGQGPDVSWVVLADPEGNEFCLLSRAVQDL